MTTTNRLLTTIVFALAGFMPGVGASAYESIPSFTADITVNQDGSFDVIESIQYNFGNAERHGIFRHIPLEHPQGASAWYRDRQIEITVDAVTLNNAVVPFERTDTADTLEIKIGDPAVTISGQHEYVIAYTVMGGLSYYPDLDPELFWDVTGTEWEVYMEDVLVRLHDPSNVFVDGRACYQGTEGTNRSCQTVTATTSLVTYTASQLLPGEGLTIAQRLSGGAVERQVIEPVKPLFSWVPLVGLLFAVFFMIIYRIKTKHKPNSAVISQYEPYPELLPMFTGVLRDGQLDPRDITAGILYLAEQGFLKIKQTERKVLFLFEVDDYEVVLQRAVDEVPTHFHAEILALLFGSGATTDTLVTLSDLKKDMSHQKANAKRLSKLRTAIADDVIERGFYEAVLKFEYVILGAIGVVVLYMFGGSAFLTQVFGSTVDPVYLWMSFSVITLLVVGLAVIYRRRTRKGYEALNHIKGFEEFLSVTGEARFKFHNAPSKNTEQFLEYLPYAVALGVEKEWAEVFKDITIASPEWYDGGSASTFNAAALSSNLGAFSTAFASSSGSSTGSSGGGSVGGGAGGGGGGSW